MELLCLRNNIKNYKLISIKYIYNRHINFSPCTLYTV